VVDTGCQIRETSAGIEIPLHVQPRARRSQIVGIHNRALKIKIAAPPVDDAANRAIVEFFSRLLGVSKSRVCIIAGEKSRDKVLRIDGLSLNTLREFIPESCLE
jgi:uncharacterized protein (TIGR00251 family)